MTMKKKIFLLMTLALGMLSVSLRANAQAKDWFIRVGAEANLYIGDDDARASFGKRIAPAVDLTIGKWFNPYWGVQLGGAYGNMRGAAESVAPGAEPYITSNGQSAYTTGEKFSNTNGWDGIYYEKWSYFTVAPEVVYNVSNGMCGYNPKRVWNVLVHVGPVFGHSWVNGESANSINATLGVTNTWRLCRNMQLWLAGRLSLFNNGFDKVTYRNNVDGLFAISAGVSFNFGK